MLSRRDVGVGNDLADAQVVIGKYLEAALLLHLVVQRLGAPAHQRLLVAPGGKRQNPAGAPQRAVADIVDEAVDLLELRLQQLGLLEIAVEFFRFGVDFEEHDEHHDPPGSSPATEKSLGFAVERVAALLKMHQMPGARDLHITPDRRGGQRVEQPRGVGVGAQAVPVASDDRDRRPDQPRIIGRLPAQASWMSCNGPSGTCHGGGVRPRLAASPSR